MSAVRFEDIAVGSEFQLAVDPVTTTQLVMYAGASGDFNRIHYDQSFAEEAGLGGVIAHGMLTMAFMGRAVTDWSGEDAQVSHIAAKFTSPVRPGDVVVVTGTVSGKQPGTAGGGEVICDLVARVGERTVATGQSRIRWGA